jgi:hypothetical protein
MNPCDATDPARGGTSVDDRPDRQPGVRCVYGHAVAGPNRPNDAMPGGQGNDEAYAHMKERLTRQARHSHLYPINNTKESHDDNPRGL